MSEVSAFVYMLRCADGSYYVGKYQGDDLDVRVSEHNTRKYQNAYTARRLPVALVWSDWFSRYDDAVACERRLKGWSRAKKEALVRGDGTALKALSKRGVRPSLILRDAPCGAPQDEGRAFGKDVKPEALEKKTNLHPEEGASAPVAKDEPHAIR